MKLCLGTVQFGMDYGLAQTKAMKVSDAVSCIDYAVQNGVSAIDTSPAYGYAESIVGEFLKKKTVLRGDLFISDKLYPELPEFKSESELKSEIFRRIDRSLLTLNTDYVDAYMFHTSAYALRPELLQALYAVKEQGKARMVGVSVYTPEEALACCESEYAGLLQIPYSILDRRMKEAGVLDCAPKMTFQARSAFIQGLIFMREAELPPYLQKAAPIVNRIHELCREYAISEEALAMGYVKKESAISYLLFGAAGIEQIRSNIDAFNANLPDEVLNIAKAEFSGIDEDLYIPTHWKK
ncbi:MAG: aldo/keto reductase [Oscillospiraceae bacterium]|nr:aldo/keto reductase [Oscillospiraceae bacterium]